MTPEFRVAGSNRVQIGCDVHSVRHVSQSIEAFGSRYLDRVFTARERRESEDSPERLAARFAGKEAVLKALRVPPTVPVPWTTIEVHADAIGAPVVTLTGPVEDF
ncbi:MAG: 4'-phosphopantetheinyl transferase superfamily protein, partial [Rhodoglobus sp.]|nr:4'-phosphopantetheinyl transferase superfamily protein [Rhodoglobus sp.]